MRARATKGFTLLEAMVAMAIFSVVALALTTFIIDSQRVNFQLQAETGASTMAQGSLDDLRWRLEQSRMLLDANSGYLEFLDLSAAPPAQGQLKLAKIQSTGAISPRAAGGKEGEFDADSVGNALFFVEALPPVKDAKSGRLVDCYRFVLYYLAQGRQHVAFGPLPNYIELLRFESVPYADFAQLDSMPEDTRSSVIQALDAKGVSWAWESNAPPKAAFSRLSGGRLVIPPDPHHRIAMGSIASAVDGLGLQETAAGVIRFTVATNTPGDLPIHTQVPRFAKIADGFPNGFEVQITGPSHGRKVFARLVLAAETHGRFYSRESQMLASVWD